MVPLIAGAIGVILLVLAILMAWYGGKSRPRPPAKPESPAPQQERPKTAGGVPSER
ncbi:MAG: hypothetical protein NTW87_09300 [Planctomycetota bacterium]|nr:hypothetical protein [Planctomycetota bacterium]